jgi:hypothetical protein
VLKKETHSKHLTHMTSNATHHAKHLETWQHARKKSLDEVSAEQTTCILT